MGSVTLAAVCVAAFAVLFRSFERCRVPLLPAIVVNYAVAFACGLITTPSWHPLEMGRTAVPTAMLGILFVLIFVISGLSAQRAGAARTTLAGRMSLVLTVTGTIILFQEPVRPHLVSGITLALIGLVLTTVRTSRNDHGAVGWLLPLLLFLCSGLADIGLTYIQRVVATPDQARTLPTACFGASTIVGALILGLRGEHDALGQARTWIGGTALGVVNFGSLALLIQALSTGSLPASTIFPVMNILAILFATGAGILLFKERLSAVQWCGIALCITSLTLIMDSAA